MIALIQAGEGNTDMAFLAVTPERLRDMIVLMYAEKMKRYPEEPEFYVEERDALLQMLDAADYSPGSRTLTNIEPEWQEWLLMVGEVIYDG
jgi:hypothetical protein